MAVCNCTSDLGDVALRLPDGTVVVAGIYPGCSGCRTGPGWLLRLYDSPESANRAHPGLRQRPVTPDAYGCADETGLARTLLDVEDLCFAADRIETADGARVGPGDDDWPCVRDWLADWGLRLVQDAMDNRARRRGCREEGRRAPSG